MEVSLQKSNSNLILKIRNSFDTPETQRHTYLQRTLFYVWASEYILRFAISTKSLKFLQIVWLSLPNIFVKKIDFWIEINHSLAPLLWYCHYFFIKYIERPMHESKTIDKSHRSMKGYSKMTKELDWKQDEVFCMFKTRRHLKKQY